MSHLGLGHWENSLRVKRNFRFCLRACFRKSRFWIRVMIANIFGLAKTLKQMEIDYTHSAIHNNTPVSRVRVHDGRCSAKAVRGGMADKSHVLIVCFRIVWFRLIQLS